MKIEKMTKSHIDDVMKLADKFYNGPAVLHPIPKENINNTINEAVSNSGMLDGYIFSEDGKIVGFSFVPVYFESEVGGKCVLIMDLYIDEEYRHRGYATQYFNFLFEHYKDAKRFRLELAKDNKIAASAYEKMGFEDLEYRQMIKNI